MTDAPRKSDRSIVPRNRPNNAKGPAAESGEGRERTKGNSPERTTPRTQRRPRVSPTLERVRHVAERDRTQRFTALLHHVYDIGRLRTAYLALKRNAAPGVDGDTWQHYGEQVETHLQSLADRLRRGAYRVHPARRVYIPKADGRPRPLGVPALEDKIVQRAVVEVLNAIYEPAFLGFSYGFRPGRNPHLAVDALAVGLYRRKVNWVLDADIRGFFDTLNHEWLIRFIEHRIGDRRIVRLIQKWLSAGVLEDGQWTPGEVGTVQGGSISPLLANIYLHYVYDLWTQRWRQTQARGDVIVVRFADDFVVGFQHRTEAEQFLTDLRERLARFGLTLHPDKTRLIEFGRYADRDRRARGDGKPQTFNFLGFTHACARSRQGKFMVLRQTMRQRWQAKLKALAIELRQRLHDPIPVTGAYLGSVVRGHIQYYGVPCNLPALKAFHAAVARLWRRVLARRSQTARVSRARMQWLANRWLPLVRVCHPGPLTRFAVTPQGRSRMR
jgi:RNA-directed DNA polymerase